MENRTFPLREVTGFMIFYDIDDIHSPGSLFPNLTIIRGMRLFHNYALVIAETRFQELNFRNLLRISRGSVRLSGQNPRLCMPKIDWDSIIMSGHVVMIGENILRSDCGNQHNNCHSCNRGLCWNNHMCQRFDQENTVYGSRKVLCHPLCLGKCVNETAKGCFACRDISELGECVQQCSEFRFLNAEIKRCITGDECIKAGKFIHGKDCVQNCPANYMVKMKKDEMVPLDHFCVPCLEKCPRICSNVPEIKTIAHLEALGSGCTIINGSLEINFNEDAHNLTAELQVYLGDIEEIHGVLKIHRSTPISSLSFLNKLRLVFGLKSNKTAPYSIRIFENQNLQSIFDWRLRNGKTLELRHGDVQINNNNMLCESEIEEFKKILIQSNPTNMPEYMSDNGNLKSCRKGNIKVFEKVLSSDSVEIAWFDMTQLENKDTKYGYILQYMTLDANEEKEFEENMLFERDMCSSFGWESQILEQEKIIDANKVHFPNATKSYILSNLKQFTTYVFTIQRYLIDTSYFIINPDSNSSVSGISEPKRFKTLMNIPSRVRRFTVPVKTSTSITLSWSVLKSEELAINRYLLYYFEVPVIQSQLNIRDYCLEPIEYETSSMVKRELVHEIDNRCCSICCEEVKHEVEEIETDDDDFAQDIIKFSEKSRRSDPEKHRAEFKNKPNFQQYRSISEEIKTYTVTHLKPYTSYAFQIFACAAHCGEYELLYMRTAYDENYDQIELNPLDQEYQGTDFRVKFNEPKLKNGAITNYIIEIKEINDQLHKTECFSCQHFIGNSSVYVEKDILPGDYIFRIRAVSLAQKGPFTDWHRYKVIDPDEKSSIGLIMAILSFVLTAIIIVAISSYYRHRIRMILRHHEDNDILMNEMEVMHFDDSPFQHNNSQFNQLAVINEHDDE
ncbi:putative molluscan insulin-related peptide(s) receptor isoform X2 [Chironomus tepperi]